MATSDYEDIPRCTGRNETEDMHCLRLRDSQKPGVSTIIWRISIVLCVTVVALLWLSKPKQQQHGPTNTLTVSEVVSFQDLFREIENLDAKINRLDRELFNMDATGKLSDPIAVEQYYRKLADLQKMRITRAQRAENYNGLARNHFTKSKTLPGEMKMQRNFLPTGIR